MGQGFSSSSDANTDLSIAIFPFGSELSMTVFPIHVIIHHLPFREIRSPPFVSVHSNGASSRSQLPSQGLSFFKSHEASACATNLLGHFTTDAHHELINTIKRQLKTVVLVDCYCIARDCQGYVALFETAPNHGLSIYLHTKMD